MFFYPRIFNKNIKEDKLLTKKIEALNRQSEFRKPLSIKFIKALGSGYTRHTQCKTKCIFYVPLSIIKPLE